MITNDHAPGGEPDAIRELWTVANHKKKKTIYVNVFTFWTPRLEVTVVLCSLAPKQLWKKLKPYEASKTWSIFCLLLVAVFAWTKACTYSERC